MGGHLIQSFHMKKKATPRIYIQLTAVWGNDDADSTIRISRRRWKNIQEGEEYATSATYYYEGQRGWVSWHFSGGLLSISGDEGRECLVDHSVEHLIVDVVTSVPR